MQQVEARKDKGSTEAPLDVPTAIRQRRSIRRFKPDAVSPEMLGQLIELTIAAPTSWNLQDWSIVLVEAEAQRTALSTAAFGQTQIVEAPVTFVFVADPNAAWSRDLSVIYDQGRENGAWSDDFIAYFCEAMIGFQNSLKASGKTREYAVKDGMIAATHLMLAAESLGLATSMMNGWEEEKVKSVVGIPPDSELAIAVLVAVGYKQHAPPSPGRLPIWQRIFRGRME